PFGIPYVVKPLNRTKRQRDRHRRVVAVAGLRLGLVSASAFAADSLRAGMRDRREISVPDQLARHPSLSEGYRHNSAIRRRLHTQRMQDGRLLRQRRSRAMAEE